MTEDGVVIGRSYHAIQEEAQQAALPQQVVVVQKRHRLELLEILDKLEVLNKFNKMETKLKRGSCHWWVMQVAVRRQRTQSKDRGLFAGSTCRSMERQMDVLAAHRFFAELDFNKWLTTTCAERGSRRDLQKKLRRSG